METKDHAQLGIGIITYNRLPMLMELVDRLQRYTAAPHALYVADDGSTDGTIEYLRAQGIPYDTGPNVGPELNKNRALYALRGFTQIILLEDDMLPDCHEWEAPWVEAVTRWGQVNYLTEFMREFLIGGAGTPDNPYFTYEVSGQATITLGALVAEHVGYIDPRFTGFGVGHVHWSKRVVDWVRQDMAMPGYANLTHGLKMASPASYEDKARIAHNEALRAAIRDDAPYVPRPQLFVENTL